MRKLIVATVFLGVVTGCQVQRPQRGGAIADRSGPDMLPGPGPLDPRTCGGQEFALTKVAPNIMLVLDRSASMNDAITPGAPTTKYGDLTNAIGALVTRYDAAVRFGATFFAADDNCQPGVVGALAAGNGAALKAQIAAHAPGGNTPTAATLDAVIASAALADHARANYLVLATDGIPNCEDYDVTRRIAALYAATPSVRTFVIGIGSETNTQPGLLNTWADAGHTARAGEVRYYQSNSSADLDAAFDGVAGDITSCDFKLDGAPADPGYLNVTENGVAVSPSPTSGWTFDATTRTVTLHGAACDALKTSAETDVKVLYGCARLPPVP